MNYFVTGATGFVGGALAKKLREAGHEVNASVRSLEGKGFTNWASIRARSAKAGRRR